MTLSAKKLNEIAFVKSRFGKEITVRYREGLPFTGVLKRYIGLGTGNPSLLLERNDGVMVWIEVNPPESHIVMGRV